MKSIVVGSGAGGATVAKELSKALLLMQDKTHKIFDFGAPNTFKIFDFDASKIPTEFSAASNTECSATFKIWFFNNHN